MSEDVVSLAERRLEPCPDVVEVLEAALKRAQQGEIRSVAIAAECTGQCTSTVHAMGDGDVAHLTLALQRLIWRLIVEVGEVVSGGLDGGG